MDEENINGDEAKRDDDDDDDDDYTYRPHSLLDSRNSQCYCTKQLIPADCDTMKRLQEAGKFIDVTLHTRDGAEIPVHRIVMASLSPNFHDMMKNPQKVQLIPFSMEVVNSLVDLAYTGKVTITERTLEEQMQLAAHYKIDIFTKICGDWMTSRLEMEVCLLTYRRCQKFCCPHVVDVVETFICINFPKLNQRNMLTEDELKKLLRREDLQANTDTLLSFLATWAASSCVAETLRQELEWLVRNVVRKPSHVIVSIGGWEQRPTNVMEVFNPLTNNWVDSPAFLFPLKIAYHSIEFLQDKLYVVGGFCHDNLSYQGEHQPPSSM